MNRLEKMRQLINELESRKLDAKVEIENHFGTLSYYLEKDPDNRYRKRIEKLLIEKENALISIENTERKIISQHNEKKKKNGIYKKIIAKNQLGDQLFDIRAKYLIFN